MQNQELSRQLQRLEALFRRTRAASGNDIEIQAHWAKYLCILSAGFIENSLGEVYCDFARNASSEPVANYVVSILSKIQNPKTSRFIETTRAFKERWGTDLETFVADNGRKEAIDSIMANRHLIAHGKSSGVTIARLQEWFEKAIEVINFIESQCRSWIIGYFLFVSRGKGDTMGMTSLNAVIMTRIIYFIRGEGG